VDIVARIVAAVKSRGLDGIAITEHNNKNYAYKVKEIVEQYFDNEILIIPGQEVDIGVTQIVELYLPGNVTFRFLAHPYYAEDFLRIDGLHGIEIENSLHNWEMNKQKIRAIAERYNLLLLANSDAHHLSEIGEYYNEISLEELCARANLRTGSQGDPA
jgi:histidinol phosphatase-like PHP family hydrolase